VRARRAVSARWMMTNASQVRTPNFVWLYRFRTLTLGRCDFGAPAVMLPLRAEHRCVPNAPPEYPDLRKRNFGLIRDMPAV
jgi:hypothetical protein